MQLHIQHPKQSLHPSSLTDRKDGIALKDLEVNCLYANLPWSPFNSLKVLSGGIYRIALTLMGSSSIPPFRTTNLRNLCDETLKKHFRGFMHSLCFRNHRNTSQRTLTWSSFVLLLTVRSSTKQSIVLCSYLHHSTQKCNTNNFQNKLQYSVAIHAKWSMK